MRIISDTDDEYLNYSHTTNRNFFSYCYEVIQQSYWIKIDECYIINNELAKWNYNTDNLFIDEISRKEDRVSYIYNKRYYASYEELKFIIRQNSSSYTKEVVLTNIASTEIEVVPEAPPISEITRKYNQKTIIKEDNFMGVTTMFNKYNFGKVSFPEGNAPIAYSLRGLAFRDSAGEYVVYENGTGTNVSNMIIDVPIYILPTSLATLKTNDIIVHPGAGRDAFVIVEEVKPNGIVVIEPRGKERRELIPEKSIFGFDFVAKVITPFEMMNINASTENPFGNILPFLFMDDSKQTNDSMLNTMLMYQFMGNNANFASNPFILYALMGKEGNTDLLPFLMMSNVNNLSSITPENLKTVIRDEIENYIDETTEE